MLFGFVAMAESSRQFRFANWNAHSVSNKWQEIEAMLSLNDLDLLCVTETWLDPESVFEFYGYLTRRAGRGGGVLILVRRELAVVDLDLPGFADGGLDAVGLSVCSPRGSLAVICAYMPPGSTADLSMWQSLLARSSFCASVLLCGDFNALSGLWGSSCTNAAGRLISGLVSDLDLVPLNDSLPTFLAGPGLVRNNLDLVFLPSSLFHLAVCRVGDDSFGSDHLPVFSSLDTTLQYVRSGGRRFNIKNLDWPCFRARCDDLARDLMPQLGSSADPPPHL